MIEGYRDGFVHTAPVGSFAANAIGLHDMGGNVLEWTVTSFDISFTKRVVRGGSWQLGTRFGAHAFARVGTPLAERHPHQGLRLVLFTTYGSHKEAVAAQVEIAPPPVMEAKPVLVKETAHRPMPVPTAWVDDTAGLRARVFAAKAGRLEGEHLLMTKAMEMGLADQKIFRDVIVRMRFIGAAGIGLRKAPVQGSAAQASYQGQLDPAPRVRLFGWLSAIHRHLFFPNLDRDLDPGFDWKAEHELTLAVQGDQITLWLDGRTLLTQRDSAIPAGSLYLNLWTPNRYPHLSPRIRKVEYGELGGTPAPAVARPVK